MNPSIHTAHAAQVLPARAALFLGIVAFHVLLAYLFASGMMVSVTKILLPQTIEVLPDRPVKPVEQIPAPPPQLIQAVVPPVDPDMPVISMEPDNSAITAYVAPTPQETGSAAPAEPAPAPLRLVGSNVLPNSADYYPMQDLRERNEGTAEIRSCVSPAGKLDGTPTVESSSGRPSLDKAAVRLARDGKYARAMRGDTPVPNCYRFRVTFTMH